MSAVEFPVMPSQLRPDWLTGILKDAGSLSAHASVREICAEPLGAERGFAGSLVRLTLVYAPDDAAAPSTLVAKFSVADDTRRQAIGTQFGMFEREVRFYKELAPRVGVRVPSCYFAAFDHVTQHSVILLEDLTGIMGDDEAGCSRQMTQRAIEALAALHARWWRSPALGGLTWLQRNTAARDADMMDLVRERYDTFRQRFGDAVPGHLWPLLDRIAVDPPPAVSGPATLIHGDASPKNVCFNDDGSVTFFDWQAVGESVAAHDLAVFLIAGMTASDRRSSQPELLNVYGAALRRNGVTDYSEEQCARDIRLAAMARLTRFIRNGGNPTATGPFLRMIERSIGRFGAFFEDEGVGCVGN